MSIIGAVKSALYAESIIVITIVNSIIIIIFWSPIKKNCFPTTIIDEVFLDDFLKKN